MRPQPMASPALFKASACRQLSSIPSHSNSADTPCSCMNTASRTLRKRDSPSLQLTLCTVNLLNGLFSMMFFGFCGMLYALTEGSFVFLFYVGPHNVYAVKILAGFYCVARLDIELQGQPLADVG